MNKTATYTWGVALRLYVQGRSAWSPSLARVDAPALMDDALMIGGLS